MNSTKSNSQGSTVSKETLNKVAEQMAAGRATNAVDINTGPGPRNPDVKNDARTTYKPEGSASKPHQTQQSSFDTNKTVRSDPIKNPGAQANNSKGKQGGSRPTEKDEQRNMFAKERQ